MTFNELLELDKRTEGRQAKRATEKRSDGRRDVARSKPRSRRTQERRSQRSSEPFTERLTERRPYDFFRDQVLWLNKTKVEIQENYGRRVTANAMVQLALDVFIEDYKRRKERSKLVNYLVFDEGATSGPNGAQRNRRSKQRPDVRLKEAKWSL